MRAMMMYTETESLLDSHSVEYEVVHEIVALYSTGVSWWRVTVSFCPPSTRGNRPLGAVLSPSQG